MRDFCAARYPDLGFPQPYRKLDEPYHEQPIVYPYFTCNALIFPPIPPPPINTGTLQKKTTMSILRRRPSCHGVPVGRHGTGLGIRHGRSGGGAVGRSIGRSVGRCSSAAAPGESTDGRTGSARERGTRIGRRLVLNKENSP